MRGRQERGKDLGEMEEENGKINQEWNGVQGVLSHKRGCNVYNHIILSLE